MNELFLFPFEWIPNNSQILIYGAGELGQAYAKQIMLTGYCRLIGMVDRNYKSYVDTAIPVYSPSRIHALLFDRIVVALKNPGGLSEVRRVLADEGVPDEKIVFVGKREQLAWNLFLDSSKKTSVEETLAWNGETFSVALFLLTAMGGMFFIKRFIQEIIRLMPDCKIDIYITQLGNAIRCFYSDIPHINAFVQNLGSQYIHNRDQYDLAMQVNSGGFLTVDVFKPDRIPSQYVDFKNKIQHLQKRIKNDEYTDSMPRIVLFQNRRFHGQNAYTAFNYGVLDIQDKTVSIPLNVEAGKQFNSMGLERYITLNYGNGSCKDGSKIAKMWPLEKFNSLIQLFKKQYPAISVVQLGTADAERIDGADRYILGEPFELVIHILKNSILHIDIEGGLVHLATQLGTKCAVLFGPTPEFYYGYEENINIKVGNCHDCCGVYMDSNRCARGMDKPECMYSITPEIVMERVKDYLTEIAIER